jgi:hypothetical protein
MIHGDNDSAVGVSFFGIDMRFVGLLQPNAHFRWNASGSREIPYLGLLELNCPIPA